MTAHPGGSLKSLRRTNQEAVLRLLLQNGAMHRADLARQMGVSRTTVSTIVNQMLEHGLVTQVGVPSTADLDGRVRELVALSPNAGVAAGVCLADDRIAVHLTDLAHRELAGRSVAVTDSDMPERAAAAGRLLDETLADLGLKPSGLLGLGVGVQGQPQVGAAAEEAFAARFGPRFGPLTLSGSATGLEAMAEYLWGAGDRADTMLYVSLSTSLHSALVTGGTLHQGASGAAGELGHLSVDFDGPGCPCGSRGCLVHKAATTIVLDLLRPVLGEDAGLDEVIAATRAGDRACRTVVSDVGTMIGRTLAGVCNLLDPGRIVVSGPLSVLEQEFLDPLRAAISRHATAAVGDATEVVAAAFAEGPEAVARGGAALVLLKASQFVSVLQRQSGQEESGSPLVTR